MSFQLFERPPYYSAFWHSVEDVICLDEIKEDDYEHIIISPVAQRIVVARDCNLAQMRILLVVTSPTTVSLSHFYRMLSTLGINQMSTLILLVMSLVHMHLQMHETI
jgi:hypothetical protein